MTEIALTELTTGSLTGDGVFDKLMSAMKAHLEAEFAKGRIKGPEYATVYLGALDQVLANSLNFVVQKRAVALQADLLAQQILLAQIEVTKAQAELDQIEAQTAVAIQQKLNLVAENAATVAKTANTVAEGLNIPKTGEVLDAQVCKLQAEFDLTVNTNTKTTGEIALLAQKTATEKAQIQAIGVDDNSVIGKQKKLYQAQTDGFARDAEQKAAKLLVDTWSARRMSDEGTVADGVNMLNDATVGRAVNKVLAGINA